MSGEQPPYNFISINENILGYDVELANKLGQVMNREIEVQLMPLADLIPALESNKVDIVMSGFSITKQRQKKVLFSIPYALAGKSIISTKDKMKQIHNTTGFNDSSVRLVALSNSSSATLASKRLAKAKLSTVKHYEDAILAILSGEADAMIADLSICELVVYRDITGELAHLKGSIATEKIAIALSKDNKSLQQEINAHLNDFKEAGLLTKWHQKWFTKGAWLPLIP